MESVSDPKIAPYRTIARAVYCAVCAWSKLNIA